MALKSNCRSFRFSDQVLSILEQHEGASLNEKFEKLVRYSHLKVPEREKELKRIESDIKKKRDEYYTLCSQMRDLSDLMNTLKTLQHYGGIAARGAEQIAKNLDHRGLPKESA